MLPTSTILEQSKSETENPLTRAFVGDDLSLRNNHAQTGGIQ